MVPDFAAPTIKKFGNSILLFLTIFFISTKKLQSLQRVLYLYFTRYKSIELLKTRFLTNICACPKKSGAYFSLILLNIHPLWLVLDWNILFTRPFKAERSSGVKTRNTTIPIMSAIIPAGRAYKTFFDPNKK